MRSGGIFGGQDALGLKGLGETSGFLCTPGLDPFYCKCMQTQVGPVELSAAPAAIAKWSPYCQQETAKNAALANAFKGMIGVSAKAPEKKEPLLVTYTGGGGAKKPVVVNYSGGGGKSAAPAAAAQAAPAPTNWLLIGGGLAAVALVAVFALRK